MNNPSSDLALLQQAPSANSCEEGQKNRQADSQIPFGTVSPAIVLRAEVFMTSGPRKACDDELGEDCCSTVLLPDRAFFLIADGTSEGHEFPLEGLPLFCSRYLAQTITACARRRVLELFASEITLDIFKQKILAAWKDTGEEWNRLLKEGTQRSDRNYDEMWKAVQGRGHQFLDFSTTFMVGVLMASGDAYFVNIGDSVCVVKAADGFQKFRSPQPGRLFMRLSATEETLGFLPLEASQVDGAQFPNADLLLAGTDGVGRVPEIAVSQGEYVSMDELILRLLRFRAKTCDDKTLCLLSRSQL